VIANAGLLTRGALTGGWDRSGAGSWRYGAERVCVPIGGRYGAEWEFRVRAALGWSPGLGECGFGRDSDADQRALACTVVLSGANDLERIDGDQRWVACDR
jgi:hypothetical protein